MLSVLNRYATPFITGLFLVSLISGLALFFHVGPSGFHAMHEWLSLLLIVPFGLHVWKNWRPMLGYLRRAPMAVALAASLLMSAPFLMPADGAVRGGPPPFQLAERVLDHTADEVAPLLGTDAETLLTRLRSAGYVAADPQLPLSTIIRASGRDQMGAIAAMLSPAG